jgi:hypothetical protein
MAKPQPFYPQERTLVPVVYEAGRSSGSVWMDMEDRKVLSKTL